MEVLKIKTKSKKQRIKETKEELKDYADENGEVNIQEAVDKVNEENKRKMEAMAAEYEAVIASLKKKDKGGKKG